MNNESVSSSDGIYTRVAGVLVEALNADEANITPAATLHGDLGAESIDLLDIVFRLEREFGVHIDRDELFPSSIFQGNPEFVQNGKVTNTGLAQLHSALPFADLTDFEGDRRLSAIPSLFTVGLVARFVAWKLDGSLGNNNCSNGVAPVFATANGESGMPDSPSAQQQ
jgi:acyl carrier protein